MSCGDKCKCDCCKAKKKAAAAAKRRNKAKGRTVKKVQERGSNAAPVITINNPKSNQLPTLNVSNHPSTMPKNIATQTGDLIEPRTVTTTGTQTGDLIEPRPFSPKPAPRPKTYTTMRNTDLTQPLPDLPDLQQDMTAPPRPAKYTRKPVSISTREPTMAVIEPPSRYAEHIENITDAMATQRHNEERERLGIRHVVRIRRPQRPPPAIPSLPDLPGLQEGMTGPPRRGPGRPPTRFPVPASEVERRRMAEIQRTARRTAEEERARLEHISDAEVFGDRDA